jgi:hypothetical protein
VTGPVESQGAAGYDQAGISATASSSERSQGAHAGGYYSGSGYTYELIPNNTISAQTNPQYDAYQALIKPPVLPPQPACPPGETGYYVFAPDGSPAGIVCLPDVTPGPTTGPPAQGLAQQASSSQPWPNLIVSANPPVGLSGLGSWFWLAGSPSMPSATASSGPLTVTVRATLADVVWDFGDGSQTDSGSSVGRAFPQQSDVSHVYQSDSYGMAGGYQVTVLLRFAVDYSVNGGAWQSLGTKARTYSWSYTVNQVQPEGVAER